MVAASDSSRHDGARPLWLWIPAGAWAATIFVLSSFSRLPSGPGGLSDKHAHVLAYALLCALIVLPLAGGRWIGVTWRTVLAAALLAIGYGITDEIHQSFVPGRDMSMLDLAADTVGACASAAGLRAWAIIRPRA